jgi:hypothetical protein
VIYSELYFKNRIKIPTIIGFLSILFVVFIFARFFANTATLSQASKKTLKRIEIGNLLHNQATIFWQTEDKEAGWVLSGEEKGKETKITLDERDVGGQKNKFYSHYVILKELKENQRYFLKLVGDDKLITNPEGVDFSFVTPKNTAASLQNVVLANGFVKEANLVDPLADAVVILSAENKNVYPLLTRTAIDGSWIIPLNGFYGKDNQEPVTIKEKDKIKIEFISEEADMSTVITNLSNISPLPQTIVIGAKNYDFTGETSVLSASTSSTVLTNKELDIIYPQEKVLIPGRIPIIKGSSLPDREVFITVESTKVFSAKVVSDDKGQWSYLLPDNLDLGEHTITVKTKGKNGEELVLQRKFTIIAQEGNEGRVLGTATGEPTIILTPTPTPTTYYYPTAPPVVTLTHPPVSGSNNLILPAVSSFSLIIVGAGLLLAF